MTSSAELPNLRRWRQLAEEAGLTPMEWLRRMLRG